MSPAETVLKPKLPVMRDALVKGNGLRSFLQNVTLPSRVLERPFDSSGFVATT
jgi:hypothetical protein